MILEAAVLSAARARVVLAYLNGHLSVCWWLFEVGAAKDISKVTNHCVLCFTCNGLNLYMIAACARASIL